MVFTRCVLCRPFLNLLGDESVLVRAEVAEQLAITLSQFQPPTEDMRAKTFADFIPVLIALEAQSGYNWRLQLALLSAFPSFVQVRLVWN